MHQVNKIVRDLSQLIRGNVVDAGEVEYQSAVMIDNGRVRHNPTVVVVPVDHDDVAVTVKYVADYNHSSACRLRLTARCGGHGASGYCLNTGGIVVDMRRLNNKAFDRKSGRLTLGMGNIWRDVYDYLEFVAPTMLPVGGGCPGVGIAGFLLGAGFSFVSRSYGLGSDNMKSLTVVKADGTIETLDKDNNPDLFWAMRGAGGGNYALAVETELEAQPTKAEDMMVGQIIYQFDHMADVLAYYNEWIEEKNFPREMAVYGYFGHQPNPRNPSSSHKVLTLRLTTIFNGNFEDGMDCLMPLLRQLPRPALVDFRRMTLPEWEDFIGAGTQVEGRSAYIRSVISEPKSMTPDVAHVFKKHMIRAPSEDSFVVWTHLGGAEEEDFSEDDGCFAFRHARYVPEVKAIWDSSKPDEMRRNVEWAYEFYEELADASGAIGAYMNYIDPLLVDWQQKYYGKYYDRLVKIKMKEDPNGFFDFQQGIGSDFNPSPPKPGGSLDLSPLKRTFA
ncbi:6-hydroxy-D-nicotine oxidase [Symmachiella dynata]|uniref:6-hydroxy-D-nicotine oxidase n=1 Tax=Symmachiella dynata TaxID=2527995 RepID=A0A517ZK43_9PLAN|nr:FAD-binding oxidoreductase [Symmachiella dynata]QDU42869.1 6-hydroxy-D-nicotine oxidase [Symmachiella dynata]